MSLAEKIQEDVKSALKGGDKKKLSISRYLSSELKNYLIVNLQMFNLTLAPKLTAQFIWHF